MKNLYLLIALMLSWLGASAQCTVTNGNFESTNTSNFIFTRDNNDNNNNVFAITNCNLSTSGVDFAGFSLSTTPNSYGNEGGTLVTATSGNYYDPYDQTLYDIGTNIYRVAPGPGGNQALKLNKSTSGADITTMSINMTSAPATIVFDYSLIIENPHPEEPNKQPFFAVRLYSGSTMIANDICIQANPDNPIFVDSFTENILYTDWQCQTITIPVNYIGNPIRIEFVIADCGQSGHFGTVYLDNIRCGSTCNVFAGVDLDVVEQSCPTEPFDVCGTYTTPVGGTANTSTLSLSFVDSNGTETPISAAATVTGNTFCFEVDPAIFNSASGSEFEFKVYIDFTIAGTVYEFSGTSQSISPDVSFDIINTATDSYIYVSSSPFDNLLYWEDIDDIYTVEFRADGTCCPGEGVSIEEGAYYTVTTTDNFTSIINAIVSLGESRCFRWRIKTNCGWSGWCCLSLNNTVWGSYWAPGCYDPEAIICDDITILNTTPNIIGSGEVRMEDWKTSITAHNIIENGGEAYYKAQNYILLLPSFYSEYGSLFATTLEECTGPDAPPTNFGPRMNMYSNEVPERETEVAANNFTVYPNPTNGLITVTGEAAAVYTVTDITSKQLMSIANEGQSTSVDIDLTGLNAGIYFLSADGKTIQKIIKN